MLLFDNRYVVEPARVSLLTLLIFLQDRRYNHDGGGYGNGIMGGMWFFSLLFWIFIIAGAVFIVRWLTERNNDSSPPTESTLEVLKKRYARGEIDQDTFEQMKRDINGDN